MAMILIFLPRSSECPVYFAWQMFESSDMDKDITIVFNRGRSDLNTAFVSSMTTDTSLSKQFVFGHSLPDGSGLQSMDGRLLGKEWWHSTGEFKVSVFHVCHGSKFLSSPANGPYFKNWVSYNDQIYMFIGEVQSMQKIKDFWRELFHEMIEVIRTTDSIQEIRRRFILIYKRGLLKLDRLPKGLAGLTQTHVIMAMDALESN